MSSFTSAAIATMRANQPQHAATGQAPRHTYSSSYARDYAEQQQYAEYLAKHADENASKRAAEREQYSQRATNNEPSNNYNILSHARDPRGSRAPAATQSAAPTPRPYVPIRAPYAQDQFEDGNSTGNNNGGDGRSAARRAREAAAEFDAPNPSRYVSSARDAYTAPDTSRIASQLPPPPSKQTQQQLARSREAPYALHDAPAKQQSTPSSGGAAVVPALALSRVPKAAFEPYAVKAPDPERTREYQLQDERDLDSGGRGDPRDDDRRGSYGYEDEQPQRQQQYGRDDRDDRDFGRDNRDYGNRDYDREDDRDFRGGSYTREPPARQQQQYDDEEDQESRPVGNVKYADYPRYGGEYNMPAHDDDDPYRKQQLHDEQYQQDYQSRAAARSHDDSSAGQAWNPPAQPDSSRPSSSSQGGRSQQPRPAYYDQPAGCASGLASGAQKNRHSHIFGGGNYSEERPRKKMVPQYDAYIESSSRESVPRRVGPHATDPDAAGARVKKAYGHLDSGFQIGVAPNDPSQQAYQGASSRQETRRGIYNAASANESIYSRNPILQNTPNYEPRPASSRRGDAAGARSEQWTSDVIPRARHGMHASMESSERDAQLRFGREDLQPSVHRDALSQVGATADRGIKVIGNASYNHHNIFGNLDGKHEVAQTQRDTERGIRVTKDRNASHGVLATRNSLYDARDSDWDRGTDQQYEREQEAHAAPQARGTTSAYKSNEPYSPRSESLAYSAAPSSASRAPRVPEQQHERDMYERELRRLHAEQADVSARGAQYRAKTQGYDSTRLW